MGRLKKFRRGEKIATFPAESWNAMAREVERLRNQLSAIEDERKPKAKSPVIVQLIWSGASAIEPGHTVQLGTAAIDPTSNDSAPFSGLKFHCSEFAGAADLTDYAITMGPISGGGSGVGYGIIPEAYWAKVSVTDAGHTNAIIDSAGTLLASATTGGLRIIWKPTGTGEMWCVVSLMGGSSTSLPPLRAFELTANKTLASATATAKWLDLDGNLVGSNVTLHDPEHRFSGRIEDDLFSGSAGHRGYAIQRTDLAAEDPDQWEIVELDGLHEFVIGEFTKTTEYPDPGSTTTLVYIEEVDSHGYDRHPPAAASSALTYEDDADIFVLDEHLGEPTHGSESTPTTLRVILKLSDPDTSPPSYRVIEVKRPTGDGRLAEVISISASAGIKIAEFYNSAMELTGTRFYFMSVHVAYDVECPDGAVILVIGEPIQTWTGSPPTVDTGPNHPRGMLVNAMDFLRELDGFGNGKVLWAGSEGEGPYWGGDNFGAEKILWSPDGADLEWDGEECPE